MNEIVYIEREMIAVRVRISENVRKKRDEHVAKRECVACERRIPEKSRPRLGQCPTCYTASRKAIKERKVTKTELIRDGKMLPCPTAGRKPSTPFTKMLRDR